MFHQIPLDAQYLEISLWETTRGFESLSPFSKKSVTMRVSGVTDFSFVTQKCTWEFLEIPFLHAFLRVSRIYRPTFWHSGVFKTASKTPADLTFADESR